MSRMSQLEEMIEHERRILNGAILEGKDFEAYYEQSKKLDELIEKYYQVVLGGQ